MKKISILLIFVLIATFFLSNKIIAQVEPLEPLPTKPLTPIKSNQSSQTTSSDFSGGRGGFAGIIILQKAKRIQELETAGYICPVLGQTIEIKKQKENGNYPKSYFIPQNIKSKYPTGMLKAILGYYSGKTTITCTHPAGAVETVILSNVTSYGVSRATLPEILKKLRLIP